jgi:DNA-binding PadR family transcriptional regulator
MLTKSDFALLIHIYNHDGYTTFTKQEVFLNKVSFYRSIKALKDKGYITVSIMELPKGTDKRFCIYEITGKGIELSKLII